MKKYVILLLFLLLLPTQLMASSLLESACMIGLELDRQMSARFGYTPGHMDGISVIVTTPVEIRTLSDTSQLSRQMQEALTSWLAGSGYNVVEIRKGRDIVMREQQGETILTRNRGQIVQTSPKSSLTMVSTYTVSGKNVYFNVRLMQTNGAEVYAMTSLSLPLNGEIRSLLPASASGNKSFAIAPSVYNRLP